MLLQRFTDTDLFSSFNDMQRLHNQLNRLFSPQTSREYPPVNVWTSQDGAIIQAEIPGIEPGGVDISLVNDTLTIRGVRAEECTNNEKSCHRQERSYGQFIRTLQLPFTVDGDKVKAQFRDGILDINLPRAEADKPRKISVIAE